MEKFIAMREEKPWNWSWTVFIFKDDLPFPAMTLALRFEVIDPWTQEVLMDCYRLTALVNITD